MKPLVNTGRCFIIKPHIYCKVVNNFLFFLLKACKFFVYFHLCSRWTTSGLKSQGRLSVGSSRDREISMSVGLGRSQLDSRGGVVGGTIDVNTLEMVGKLESCFVLVYALDSSFGKLKHGHSSPVL